MKKVVVAVIFFTYFLGSQSLEARNICQEHKKEISNFISRFENLQKKHQAGQILDLFTPSTEPEDVATYSFFAGLDAAGPRLYSTGITAFTLKSFKVIDIYESWWVNGCSVNVVEKRKYYPHGERGKASTARHVLNFELLYWYNGEERIWQVNAYRPYGFVYGKFSGFEF